MCEVPARSWRALLRPHRVVVMLAALAVGTLGALLDATVGLVLIGIGAALLVMAVLLPAVTEIELGFPAGVKLVAAAHQREEQLRSAFTDQRGELELCARLLCGDEAVGSRLLEAAWAQAAGRWRGPVGPPLRTFVLCVLVGLARAHLRWGEAVPTGTGPLAGLPFDDRATVVLHEFAGLTPVDIAPLLGRPVPQVEELLRTAEGRLAARGTP